MRPTWRTADPALVRDVSALGVACLVQGVSFGAIGLTGGLSWWLCVAMSTLVFAGGAQFLAIGLFAAGNPAAAVLGGLLLNARHLPFGVAVHSSAIGRHRWLGAHLLVDETVAFALAQSDADRRRRAYWMTGGTLFVTWNAGTLIGIALGGVTTDPAALGLDAAFPAGLIALLMPSLRDALTRRVAIAGAVVAVATAPFLPAGLPVLLALTGLAVLLVGGRR
jgi:4-azaleucine resistance transporter AzlC